MLGMAGGFGCSASAAVGIVKAMMMAVGSFMGLGISFGDCIRNDCTPMPCAPRSSASPARPPRDEATLPPVLLLGLMLGVAISAFTTVVGTSPFVAPSVSGIVDYVHKHEGFFVAIFTLLLVGATIL